MQLLPPQFSGEKGKTCYESMKLQKWTTGKVKEK
jgi:hypothetical protein